MVKTANVDVQLLSRHPSNTAELRDMVRQAFESGQAIYAMGGRTQWDLVLPPSRPGFLLDIRKLDQVIDYPARDMTITVQAGITLARLQALLASEKQWLPIDVPHADQATVGGTLAANVSGPRRYAHGTLRDYLIGISVVNDEGHETKAGGRVVKNVAGYDLCKLYIGSHGTLGVITQVTFKVRPLPEQHALFAFSCPADGMEAALTRLHASEARPVSIELLNPQAARLLTANLNARWPRQWSIIVGFEGNTDALRWQVQALMREFGAAHNVSGALGSCGEPIWRALTEFPVETDAVLSFKAGVPAAAVAAFCWQLDAALSPVSLLAHAGNGIVIGGCSADNVREKMPMIRALASSLGGHLVVTRCPVEWKTSEFVWGPPRSDAALMRAVKDKLDPRRIFNPGRFVNDI